MVRKFLMSLGALNTILSTAPLIIQGAAKLIQIIRKRTETEQVNNELPSSPEGLNRDLREIHARLDAHNESDLAQIKLIEELAKQHQLLADSLQQAVRKLNLVTVLALLALCFCIFLAITVILA